jgi:hypothetical protein
MATVTDERRYYAAKVPAAVSPDGTVIALPDLERVRRQHVDGLVELVTLPGVRTGLRWGDRQASGCPLPPRRSTDWLKYKCSLAQDFVEVRVVGRPDGPVVADPL